MMDRRTTPGEGLRNEPRPARTLDVLQGIIEGMADLVAAVDPSFRFLAFNRAYAEEFKKLFGREIRVGESVVEALAHVPRDQADAMEFWGRALAGESFTVVQEFGDERRARKWYELRFSPIRDATGILGASHIVRDVTELKRADAAIRRSEAVLAHAGKLAQLGAWSIEVSNPDEIDANPVHWSDEVYRIFGYEPGAVKVTHALFFERVHPEDRQRVRDLVARAIAARQPYYSEYRIVRLDGTERAVVARADLTFGGDGRLVRIIGAVQDVTDRRQAEVALRESEQHLREAARRKDEFLGMLSHELRNPLAPIRNAVYILRHAEPCGEQARRAQDVIERQAEHLTRLVDDLLDVTRIARGKIELRRSRLDLRDVARRTADDFHSVLEDRGVAFRTVLPEAKVWVDADATRITQLVGNLLHNASKFTRRGDEVILTIEVTGSEAQITVRDSGAGIDAVLLPRVFEPFVQGERTLARTEGGLGLGLALVKGIATLHGGTATAESAGNGKGSRFIVRLPLVEDAPVQQFAPVRVERRNRGRRVLVVDDNPDAADSLAEIVAMLGHGVDVAYDGPTAIAKARANPPDVVLCDIGLPGMSGYEVANTLRKGGDAMQLFAVSGYAQPEDVKRAVEAGFDGHIAKPPDVAELERLLA